MAITVFNKILSQATQAGQLTNKSTDAITWLRDKASNVRTVDTNRVIQQGVDRNRTNLQLGRMYLFSYDPKLKDTLPYHDKFPLIFPFAKDATGFWGINMHYLPFQFRAILMDSLYELINDTAKQDETTKLRLTYNVLNSAAKFKYFKPCVKHYLNSQVQSKFIYIMPNEWDVALFLPLHKFVGATASAVYRDSRRRIAGR